MKWAIVVACSIAGADASADRAPTSQAEEAARLFEEGRTQKVGGDLVAACMSFERSYQLERAAGTALNLAECEEHAGNWEYALELYEGAATVFEQDDRGESARFARKRAAKLRAAHPAEVYVPLPAVAPEQSNKLALGIGIGGLSIGAIGLAVAIDAYATMKEFNNTVIPPDEMVMPPTSKVSGDDCGTVTFSSPDIQKTFEDSCAAQARMRWIAPVMLISTGLGVGALAYYFWTKPKKRSSVAITPTASGGVMATFEW